MASVSSRWQDFVFPVGIVAGILVILVPLPTAVMDLLLALNITLSVIVLLTTIYVRRPLDFSLFPTLLLAATLGRLVLNVATTRLILSHADTLGMQAAGDVIRAFGQFVAGDRIVVGLIMFAIIVVIQFVVITKGATRISEVAARFALDGMPGRQMAIDADLNAGVIDQQQARRQREELARQSDFYGAMDGASKFVRGDAIAGILITLVNIAGGLVIGVGQSGMSLAEAAEVYTMLTIGDGLVSQVPALLISLAAGLLVTRSTQAGNLPSELLQQLFARPQALLVAAVFLGLLVFTNLPAVPLVVLGGCCAAGAWRLARQQQREAARQASERRAPEPAPARGENLAEYLAVDPMELEIGIGLIRLADPQRGGDLLARITAVRKQVATEIGIVLPKVRIRDNMRLDRYGYRIKIGGSPVAEGRVYPSRRLAVNSGSGRGTLDGEPARDPYHQQPAFWIGADAQGRAEAQGFQLLHPTEVLAAELSEVVRHHADELLTRDATQLLVEELRKTSPVVVDELIPGVLKLGEIQQVLQRLLREHVPIKPLGTILEALGDHAATTRHPARLTEFARRRLARTLCARYRDAEGRLQVITLDPELEEYLASHLDPSQPEGTVCLPPAAAENIQRNLVAELALLTRHRLPPIVLVSPPLRHAFRQLTVARLPRLVVLGYNEITPDTRVETVGMLSATAALERLAETSVR